MKILLKYDSDANSSPFKTFPFQTKVHPMALCGHHPSDPISYHFPLTCSPLAILASYSVLNHIPPRPASGPVRLLLSLSPMLFPCSSMTHSQESPA